MNDFAWIRERIDRIPRVKLALTPTPLQDAPNLSRTLGGPRILVKRDDLTGVAFGGNKLRNLEFRLAHALKDDPDTILVGLDIQSNSARQTVGACNKLGLRSVLVLEGEPPDRIQGNLLVNYLLGADVIFASTRQEQRAALDDAAQTCRARGGRPHILNDNPMFDIASALAYLETTLEILGQLQSERTSADAIYMSSSGKGQAGLVLGHMLTNGGIAVHGVTATHEFEVRQRTSDIANRTLALLGLPENVSPDAIINDDRFVGDGYGVPSTAGIDAVRLFAVTEGIVLDPVYTGKAAAGMIADIRTGRFSARDTVIFVHTGGTPAIFTWDQLWVPQERSTEGLGNPCDRTAPEQR